jgi:hypothetical protein
MNDEKFENYLREFEPKKPRALPLLPMEQKANTQFSGRKRLAAAAAVVLVCGVSLWTGLRERPSVRATQRVAAENFEMEKNAEAPKRTVFEWTKAALEDSEQFEATMSRESQRILPRFDLRDSALRVLTKE